MCLFACLLSVCPTQRQLQEGKDSDSSLSLAPSALTHEHAGAYVQWMNESTGTIASAYCVPGAGDRVHAPSEPVVVGETDTEPAASLIAAITVQISERSTSPLPKLDS